MEYLYCKRIFHRDIKLDNILYNDNSNEIKIIDFGFSTYSKYNEKLNTFCGTPNYMSPELILKKEYFGAPVDIWAFGILSFKLFFGNYSDINIDKKDIKRRLYIKKEMLNKAILYSGIFENELKRIWVDGSNIFYKCLNENPKERPMFSDILSDKLFKF